MAKKLSVEDMKAGRIYRCGHCDAKCDDELRIAQYNIDDVYLGRIDEAKKKYSIYCSFACIKYVYIQDHTEFLININLGYKDTLDRWIQQYRENIKQKPEGSKYILEYIKLLKYVIRFNQAWLEHKSEYELHELRLKATKCIGDFMETNHSSTIAMNKILKYKKCIDHTDITLFG